MLSKDEVGESVCQLSGAFAFHFWKCNRWICVIVDDRLPFRADKTEAAFTRSQTGHVFWGPLVEKAYAKLHGSYEVFKRAENSCEIMVDLTGKSIRIMATLVPRKRFTSITSVPTHYRGHSVVFSSFE